MNRQSVTSDKLRDHLQNAFDYLNESGALKHPDLAHIGRAFENTGLVSGIGSQKSAPGSDGPEIVGDPWTMKGFGLVRQKSSNEGRMQRMSPLSNGHDLLLRLPYTGHPEYLPYSPVDDQGKDHMVLYSQPKKSVSAIQNVSNRTMQRPPVSALVSRPVGTTTNSQPPTISPANLASIHAAYADRYSKGLLGPNQPFQAWGHRARANGYVTDASQGNKRTQANNNVKSALTNGKQPTSTNGKSVPPTHRVRQPIATSLPDPGPWNIHSPHFMEFGGHDVLQPITNLAAGAGDSLSIGATDELRNLLKVNGQVDHNSPAYHGGELTEMGVEALATGGSSVLKSLAKKKIAEIGVKGLRKEARQQIEKLVRSKDRIGKIFHHQNSLLGHPVNLTKGRNVPTLFPTAGLPPAIHSGKANIKIFDEGSQAVNRVAHNLSHQRQMTQEKILKGITNRYTVPVRIARNVIDAKAHQK